MIKCDESPGGLNLMTPERALFMKRRKDAYEAPHPETKNRAIGNGREKVRQVGEATSERFTADTAVKAGHSERYIQRDTTCGERISEEVLQEIAGTDPGQVRWPRKGSAALRVENEFLNSSPRAKSQVNLEDTPHSVQPEMVNARMGRIYQLDQCLAG